MSRTSLRIPIGALIAFYNTPSIRNNIDVDSPLFYAAYDDEEGEPRCTEDHIGHWFGEIAPAVAAYLREHAGFWQDKNNWYIDRRRIPVIHVITEGVVNAYDNGGDDYEVTIPGLCEPVDPWRFFDLGGDDSVDYNGGYLETVVDLIEYYLNNVPDRTTITDLYADQVEY